MTEYPNTKLFSILFLLLVIDQRSQLPRTIGSVAFEYTVVDSKFVSAIEARLITKQIARGLNLC